MKKKVLVIEDDEGIRDAISFILEEADYSVETLSRGEETFAKIATFKPDMILLDVLMSGIDGREICKKLKSDVNWQKIPVVMISAHPSAKQTVLDCGADAFLAKPFEADDLVNLVGKYTQD